jgi:hypothetical protein
MGHVSAKKIGALCEQLGTYDSSCIQSTFPSLSRYQIAKLVQPYSQIIGHICKDESDVPTNKWHRLAVYRYVGDKGGRGSP